MRIPAGWSIESCSLMAICILICRKDWYRPSQANNPCHGSVLSSSMALIFRMQQNDLKRHVFHSGKHFSLAVFAPGIEEELTRLFS